MRCRRRGGGRRRGARRGRSLRRRIFRQAGRFIAGIDSHRHGFRDVRGRDFFLPNWCPLSGSDPRSLHVARIAVQSAAYGEQSLRTSSAIALVYCARLERHGHGIGLVGGCVPEFAVDQNRDGHQRCLAVVRELEHGKSARTRFFFPGDLALSGSDLRALFLRGGNDRPSDHADQHHDQNQAAV